MMLRKKAVGNHGVPLGAELAVNLFLLVCVVFSRPYWDVEEGVN